MDFAPRKISPYAIVDPENLMPIKFCQMSQIAFNELQPQMKWANNRLVPTGQWRGAPYIDPPDPQDRIPNLKEGPPVKNPSLLLEGEILTQAQILANLNRVNFNE